MSSRWIQVHRRRLHCRCLAAAVWYCALFSLLTSQAWGEAWGADRPWRVERAGKIVAFADVHGAYPELIELLEGVGLIDAQQNWTGGTTHLVSLGDLIDRGAGSRRVLDLMMRLESQAAAAGGAVHAVLGNHEVMVMTGDLRYVSRAEFAAFAAEESEQQREKLYARFRKDRILGNDEASEESSRRAFEEKYPPGFIALGEAFSSSGIYGQWLLRSPLVLKVNKTIFAHGGVSSDLAEYSLNQINGEERSKIRAYMELVAKLQQEALPLYVERWTRSNYLNAKAAIELEEEKYSKRPPWFGWTLELMELEKAFVFGDTGPLWYRGSASCHPYSESFNTERVLKAYGARRLVVGHTPTASKRVTSRIDGQVIQLDTGMLAQAYKGRPSALVIERGRLRVYYAGESELVALSQEERDASLQAVSISDADVEDFLATATITKVRDLGTGITKPKRLTLEKDGVSLDAVFKYFDSDPRLEGARRYEKGFEESDRYQYDIAAYLIDRQLGLNMVPVAVPREVEGRSGAVQLWLPNSVNERDRLAEGEPFDSYCDQQEQYRMRVVFDVLLHNEDRNLTNLLWSKNGYMLHLIDHGRAFRRTTQRPKPYRKAKLQLSDLVRSRLEALELEGLQRELSRYLHPKQIEALLQRRDLILKEAVGTGG